MADNSYAQYKAVRRILEQKVRHGQARKDVARQLVEEMLLFDVPIAARYEYVDVIRILQDNCCPFNPGLEALIRGLSILEKYGKNLLRAERPPLWRVVRLSNSIFKEEVDIIKGAREILAHLGYSKAIDDGLSYPDDLLIPDIPVVTSVTSDILLLRIELIMLAHHEHRRESTFYSYIPAIEIRLVQERTGVVSTPHEQEFTSALTLPTPPTYQQVLKGVGQLIPEFQPLPPQNSVAENRNGQIFSQESVTTSNNDVAIEELCDLCGTKEPVVKCNLCDGQVFCSDCNELWHNNPKRKSHKGSLIHLSQEFSQLINNGNNELSTLAENAAQQEPGTSYSPLSTGSHTTASNESEFNMQMNQMAIELMDISDPMRKQQRLRACLEEIDKEAAKYKNVVGALQVTTHDKSQLVQHLTSKLEEIEELKTQFKVICGIQDNIPNQQPWQLPSTDVSAQSLPYRTPFQSTAMHSLPSSQQSLPVMEAQLIDLEPPAEPIENASFKLQTHAAMPGTSNGELPHMPPILLGNDIHMGLKRNFSNEQVEVHQPFKVQRNGPSESQTTQISNQLETMNIESSIKSGNIETQDLSDENEFQSDEDTVVPNLDKRIEVPVTLPSIPFLSNLSKTELQHKMKKEELRLQTTQFLDHIRAGDASSFRPEQVEVAVHELDKVNILNLSTPNSWLERNWVCQVQDFIMLAKGSGIRISPEDAEDVLLEADNVFDKALELIKTAQNEQIQDIADEHGFDSAKRALAKHKGDKYHALASLQKNSVTEVFQEFQKSNEGADGATDLKRALQTEDAIIRKNALSAFLQLNDGIYSETFSVLLNSIPIDLMDTLLEDAVDALTGNGMVHDVQAALHYLDNECMICTEKFPRSKITCLSACGNECKYCISCLEQHLTICVNDKNIRDIVCPVCSNPKFDSDEETKSNFINHVDAILRNMPDKKVHEIFQQKLRDFTLMRLPNFRWCSHCSGGFQFDAIDNNIKMLCPFCHKHTCYKCKKQWEPQHDGISCEQFQKWKEANDPEFQAAGLARHLRENGIDCPDCKFRYALAKGGCMHFKCTQCSHEFCSGCSQAFKHGRQCGKLPSCVSRGLHAHHPRDCLFFLRDAEPMLLLKLLKDNNIEIDLRSSRQKTCDVMEQKDTPTGLKDAPCNRAVEPGLAGLCKLHYMEYLVNLVNTHGLDPANILTVDQLKTCLLREDIEVPEKHSRQSNEVYRNKLLAEVKKLPLIHQMQESG